MVSGVSREDSQRAADYLNIGLRWGGGAAGITWKFLHLSSCLGRDDSKAGLRWDCQPECLHWLLFLAGASSQHGGSGSHFLDARTPTTSIGAWFQTKVGAV